jgi:hypothetical protein
LRTHIGISPLKINVMILKSLFAFAFLTAVTFS